jgi:hypothetical protein
MLWVAAAFIPVQLAISPVQLPVVWRIEATAVGAVIVTAIGVIALVHPRREEARALLADVFEWIDDPALPTPVVVALGPRPASVAAPTLAAPGLLAARDAFAGHDVFVVPDAVPARNAFTARGLVAARDLLPVREAALAHDVVAVPYVDPEDMPVLLGEIWSADDGGWLELPPRTT